jgi:hypothetical protein
MSDIRNFVSQYAMEAVATDNVDPSCIWNIDDTQYSVGPDGRLTKLKVVTIPSLCSEPASINDDDVGNGLNIAVKSRVAIAANGEILSAVLIFADNTLKEGEFQIYRVKGLTHFADNAHYGYIVFSKTRSCSLEFNKYYFEHVFVPEVEIKRNNAFGKGYGPELSTEDQNEENKKIASQHRIVVGVDGEQLFLDAMLSVRIDEIFVQKNIVSCKGAASCSSNCNANDASKYFMATKTRTKTIIENDLRLHTAPLRQRLDSLLLENKSSMSKGKRDEIVDAACRVIHACQQTCKPQNQINAFLKIGLYPLNLDRRLSACTTKHPPEVFTEIKKKMPEYLECVLVEGFVFEDLMSTLPFTDDGNKVPKDKRPLQHQRAVMTNHTGLMATYRVGPGVIREVPIQIRTEAEKTAKKNKKEAKEKKKVETGLALLQKRVAAEERKSAKMVAVQLKQVEKEEQKRKNDGLIEKKKLEDEEKAKQKEEESRKKQEANAAKKVAKQLETEKVLNCNVYFNFVP